MRKPACDVANGGVPIAITVPEPNTWREILKATENRPECRIAVQEFGRPSLELIEGRRARGADVTTVPVYQWDLPAATVGLCARPRGNWLARRLRRPPAWQHPSRWCNCCAWLTKMEWTPSVRDALKRMVVASVGPSTSETLRELDIEPDFEPSHPKMGFLLNELGGRANQLLQLKR